MAGKQLKIKGDNDEFLQVKENKIVSLTEFLFWEHLIGYEHDDGLLDTAVQPAARPGTQVPARLAEQRLQHHNRHKHERLSKSKIEEQVFGNWTDLISYIIIWVILFDIKWERERRGIQIF